MAKKIPLRQCIGCGEMKSKKEMMRVLKTAEGDITLDLTGRKNGRGAYLCHSAECMKKARKNKGLEEYLVEEYDAYQKQLEYFVECIREGRQPEVITPEQSYEVISMIDAIHRSADSGEIIAL